MMRLEALKIQPRGDRIRRERLQLRLMKSPEGFSGLSLISFRSYFDLNHKPYHIFSVPQ